jgi:hypothetical protein
MEVKDVATLVDQRTGWGVLLQQRPFRQLAELELDFCKVR